LTTSISEKHIFVKTFPSKCSGRNEYTESKTNYIVSQSYNLSPTILGLKPRGV